MNEGAPLRFFMSAPNEETDAIGESMRRVDQGFETPSDAFMHLGSEMGGNGFEQLFHARHVVVDRPARDAGLKRQVADAQVNGASFGEQAECGLVNAPLYRI